MWDEKRFGREMFQNEPFVKNLTKYSRNTTPYYIYYIILYIFLLSHEKSGFVKNVQKTKKNSCKTSKILKSQKKLKKRLAIYEIFAKMRM